MAEGAPNVAEIIRYLPRKIQVRFDSLGNYVKGLIDEESARRDKEIKLSSEHIQLIQLAALIYSLDSFMRAGSYAAQIAASTFEEYELRGFQVGSSVFTENNENTLRGRVLADKLRATVARTRLGVLIRNSSTMRDLISTLIREMNNE